MMKLQAWGSVLTWTIGLALILPESLYGASPVASGSAGAFLKIGMDARALSMGGAYTALAEDASAAYWNPAGLALMSRQELTLTYAQFPESGEFSQMAYALPLNDFSFPEDSRAGEPGEESAGTLAVYVMRLTASNEVEARRTDSLNPDYLFSDIEGCYGLVWGMPLGGNWQAGIAAKGLYHILDQEQATGWSADVGVSWKPWGGLVAGLAVRDAWGQMQWSTLRREDIPLTAKSGIAYSWTILAGHSLQASGEVEQRLGRKALRYRAGMEYGFEKSLFLRVGCDEGYLAMGGGIHIPRIGWGRAGLRLDYAAVQDRIKDWDHWITLAVLF